MKIALIAHEGKKMLMENLCIAYRYILMKHSIIATGTTGEAVEKAANISVQKYLASNMGGEQQLGAHISHNDVDLLIFLRDPNEANGYETDANNLMRLCDMHNIPIATNLATAEVLLLALDRGDLDWRENMRK